MIREINRNRRKRKLIAGRRWVKTKSGSYDPTLAQVKYQNRRRQSKYAGMKVYANDELRDFIVQYLKKGWSPETIAGRMKEQGKSFYASREAIYSFLYSARGQRYCKYLESRKYSKRKRKGKKQKRTLILNKTSIHDRPDISEKDGHYEGDTVVSGKKTRSTTALATIYERRAMYIDAKKIKSLSPIYYNPAMKRLFGKLKETKSLTLDNGIENVHHEELQRSLNIKIYFCDPYSSWQKPGIENANKLIRKFIPKGANISAYSDRFVRKNIKALNDTPRKALGYKTPNEIMKARKLLKIRSNKKPARGALGG